MILEWLDAPREKRTQLATQLHNFLKEQTTTPLGQKRSIPCRRSSGLYRFIPWRMAKWLRHVLPAKDSVIDRVRTHIQKWSESQINDECSVRG
ncbi:MAG: hypothetical protein WD065_02875 [Planctomycetaceae bacterium]